MFLFSVSAPNRLNFKLSLVQVGLQWRHSSPSCSTSLLLLSHPNSKPHSGRAWRSACFSETGVLVFVVFVVVCQCWRNMGVSARGPNPGLATWRFWPSNTMSCSQTKSLTSPETEESLERKAEKSCELYSLYKVCMAEMGAGICSKICFGGTEEMGRLALFLVPFAKIQIAHIMVKFTWQKRPF